MIKLYDNGVYLLNGTEIVEDAGNVQTPLTKEEAAKNTYGIGNFSSPDARAVWIIPTNVISWDVSLSNLI